jgi:hypothetical protein
LVARNTSLGREMASGRMEKKIGTNRTTRALPRLSSFAGGDAS